MEGQPAFADAQHQGAIALSRLDVSWRTCSPPHMSPAVRNVFCGRGKHIISVCSKLIDELNAYEVAQVFSRERIVDEIVTFAPAAHLLDAPRAKDKNRPGW